MGDDGKQQAAQRAMWERGDYARTASDILTPLGGELAAACGVASGQRVLDVAAGSGNAAISAAASGAQVVASDFAPKLLAEGRRTAADRGLELEWVEADAENLPFEDGEFDVVMSCIGAMFAPDHQRTADEMLRVCRTGGVIGMLNWSESGSIAKFFGVFAPYLPPPPEAVPPLKWGDPDHVRSLFGDRVEQFESAPGKLPVEHFASPEEFRAYYKTHFGPTITTYAAVVDDPERTAALDRDFLDYARKTNLGPEGGPARYGYDYLVMTARKRGD